VIPATVLHDNSHMPQTRHFHYELSCKLIHILLATSFLNFHYLTPAPPSNFHPLTVSRINLTRMTLPTIIIIIIRSEYDVWFHNRPDLASLADSCFLRYVTPADTPFSHAQQHCSQFHKLKCSKTSGYFIYHRVTQQQILHSAHTAYLCGSQNKQRLFPYTALTDWFL
jgi:hypothetical protein